MTTKAHGDLDVTAAYIVRAIILALLFWVGATLLSLDRNVAVIEQRLTSLEGHFK